MHTLPAGYARSIIGSHRGSRWPSAAATLHYWLSAALAVALFPLLWRLNLPRSFDWKTLVIAYWLVLAAESIFVAIVLYVVTFPRSEAVRAVLAEFRSQKPRVIFVAAFFVILAFAFSWGKALVLTVDAVGVLAWTRSSTPDRPWTRLRALLLPAMYLFAGFLLVFAYNDIILSVRYFGGADASFNTIDRWLLHGYSVSDLSHAALRILPRSAPAVLEFIYFGMFPQIGAALILTTLSAGSKRGLQFVGAILTAYYLALLLFYLLPSQGPYFLCPNHFSIPAASSRTWAIQKQSLANSLALWHHRRIRFISTDYYIAFPCMHIAQPLIVMWFLRKWKAAVALLAGFDVLLLGAILLLEWHYLVDVLGGVLVAACAIALIDGWGSSLSAQGRVPSQRYVE